MENRSNQIGKMQTERMGRKRPCDLGNHNEELSWFDIGPMPGTDPKEGIEKKVNKGFLSEIRTVRSMSRAKQAQL